MLRRKSWEREENNEKKLVRRKQEEVFGEKKKSEKKDLERIKIRRKQGGEKFGIEENGKGKDL